jgi:PHD/YefM family antitoxin component YafN of YafNO toxin-antitoxin module
MRMLDISAAHAPLSEYARRPTGGPLVVTRRGKPALLLLPVEGADRETVSLMADPAFVEMIERSRASYRATGGVSLEEVRRKYGLERKTTRKAVSKPARAAARKRR